MLGVDANILVRIAVQDDDAQTRKVISLIDDGFAAGNLYFVNNIALCEAAWVLRRIYAFGRDQIAGFIQYLLANVTFEFENRLIVKQTLDCFIGSSQDFPDILIGLVNQGYGCATTYTFDRKAARLPAFQLLT